MGHVGCGEVVRGDQCGEVSSDGVLILGGDRVGFDGVLINVGSVEIVVLISMHGDWVLIAWVPFQWGFDRVGSMGIGF